jgi:hypothetical protein
MIMKNLLKICLLTVLLGPINFAKADCTLTSKPGTDGRCFQVNGEYQCLQREEDTSCFTVAETDPTDPGVGG